MCGDIRGAHSGGASGLGALQINTCATIPPCCSSHLCGTDGIVRDLPPTNGNGPNDDRSEDGVGI